MLICSCSDKSDSIETAYLSEENSNELTFSASISASTRVASNAFETGDKILVSAHDGTSLYASQVEYSYDGTIFSSDTPIKYTSSTQNLSFNAVYPSTVSLAENFTFSVLADQSSGNNYEMSDLLVSVAEATNDACPTLLFKHKFTSLVVNITTEGKSGGVMSFNAKGEATVDLTNSSVVASGSVGTVTPLYSADSYKAILAPQSFDASSLVASYTVDSITYEWIAEAGFELLEGYRHTYNWDINSNKVTLVSYIEGWDDEKLINYPTVGDTISLASLSATSIPTNNLWVITDATATTADFAGFSAAIEALATSSREIYVEFPNLDAIPDYAIFGKSSADISFASDALVYVTAPKALSVGYYAFQYCSSLEVVDLPAATNIDPSAFVECESLTTVNMPLVETIGAQAFNSCVSLTSVDLPKATSVGSGAFYGCSAMTSAYLPELTSVGYQLFYECSALATVDVAKATTVGSEAFRYCSALSSIDLPVATTVGSYAFESCSALSSASLPVAETVGSSAFYSCSALATVDISKLESIDYLFLVCPSLTDMKVNSSYYVVEDGVLYDASKTTAILGLNGALSGNLTLPSSVTTISSAAFYSCTALTSISAPSVITIDGYDAFYDCTALTTVDFPVATSVGSETFYRCSALTSASIPSAIYIDQYVFSDCSALTTVDMSSATSIGFFAFRNCTSLADLKVNSSYYAVENGVLYDASKTTAFLGLNGAFSANLTLPYSVTTIDDYAFFSCTALTSVSAPSVTTINYYSFAYCDALTTVDFPAATTIGYYAFAYCDALTSMSLATEDGVALSSVGSTAFADTPTENITLTLSAANANYVSGNTLAVGDFSATFKEIIVSDYLAADLTNINFNKTADSSIVVTVNTNVSGGFVASISDTDNFSVSVDSSAGTVTVTALKDNTSSTSITATLTISLNNSSTISAITIPVTQLYYTAALGELLEGGIIYELASDGSYTMVFSMEQADGMQLFTSTGVAAAYTDSLSMDREDGYANCEQILSWSEYTETNCPAYAWAKSLGDGWYIPAYYELSALLAAVYGDGLNPDNGLDSTITAAITAAGADAFSVDGVQYYSSTIYSTTHARMARFTYSTAGYATGWQTNSLSAVASRHVRAVKKVMTY